MHLATTLIPAYCNTIAMLLMMLCLPVALLRAPWSALRLEPGRIHLVAGGTAGCLLLWLLNIRVVDGLVLHLLGVTTLTLVIGWSLSLLAGSLSLLAFTALLGLEIGAYPLAWLLNVMVPASITALLARLLYRPGLRNPFYYILGAGFAGGGLVVLFVGLLAGSMFSASGMATWAEAARQFWPLLLLMIFSEGFINGLCVSALAIFFPHWLKTFDDRFYFDDGSPPQR